ncbi:MAG: hypothetical protein U0P30_14380 [Vicinamibacterales bacterium]
MSTVRAFALVVVASSLGCDLAGSRVVQAGLYFERVSFSSPVLGGALAAADLGTIEQIARDEMAHAFAGRRIAFDLARRGRYRVAVVQAVRDPRFRAEMLVAGESRAITGVGGQGAVNFPLLAASALSCLPAGASRAEMLSAIGRGVGRAAVHEFAHQLLPAARLHDARDPASYEYASAGRCQQYVGEMHWDLAGPLLQRRLGG